MAGDIHFYSRNPGTPGGYVSEGVAAYLFEGSGKGRVALYRFVNEGSGAHFYSLNKATPAGYKAEGVEGYVLAAPLTTPPSTPFYRFYKGGSGNHFYQTSPQAPAGYVAEGFEGHVFTPEAVQGTVRPLYRFYNSAAGIHFYTAQSPQTPAGYVGEGIAGYVFIQPGAGRTRLYRFVNVYSGAHFYSTKPDLPSGYVLEEEVMYVLTAPASLGSAPLRRYYRPQTNDHFYHTDTATPAGYVAEGFEGHVMTAPATKGVVPLYRFYMPGQGDGGGFFSDAWDAFTGFVGGIVDTAVGALGVFTELLGSLLGGLLAPLLYLGSLLKAIPYVGRLFALIDAWVKVGIWVLASLVDAGLSLLGIRPWKTLRLTVVIQRDERGEPVCRIEDAILQLNFTIEAFKEAKIRVVPAHQFSPTYGNSFVVVEKESSAAKTLDVHGATDGLHGDNLGKVGSAFELKMAELGGGSNFRRLTGYGAPIIAFAVRSFIAGQKGTSLGPNVDYVLVRFGQNPSTLAHECGHACFLGHRGKGEEDNLMHETWPRGSKLTSWQITAIRTSPHVTYM